MGIKISVESLNHTIFNDSSKDYRFPSAFIHLVEVRPQFTKSGRDLYNDAESTKNLQHVERLSTSKGQRTKSMSLIPWNHTVGGKNPAPVDIVNITLFAGVYTSQVVFSPDFWTINSTCSPWNLLDSPKFDWGNILVLMEEYKYSDISSMRRRGNIGVGQTHAKFGETWELIFITPTNPLVK